eukprot:CAMPEP_0173316430 /NCGR_PEP_ID=MMETSP1143-20121109/26498_1 /TAXON_ID=483371 /ORGANISM="non described non described, Strain CCMP2298" /LENGTH=268 /DNA_ID=CAMNT_0014259365 /DNA_START=63 /DNA_END=867 /DNA_ORIENTATION=-
MAQESVLESTLDCERWERFDDNTGVDWGNSEYIESQHLRHFLEICNANDVKTIWEACQRWPRLLSTTVRYGVTTCLFPEAMFEHNRRAAYDKPSDANLSTAILARAFGLPDGVSALIRELAQDPHPPVFQAWKTNLTPDGLTARTMIERESPEQETLAHLLGGEDQDEGDEVDDGSGDDRDLRIMMGMTVSDSEDEGTDSTVELTALQPCIHAPIGEWIRLYEEAVVCNVYGQTDSLPELRVEENNAIRALLHGLLEAMGFRTLEAAE